MKYLVGGSTGLLKEVETADRSLRCSAAPTEQALERRVTCMSWSGGDSGEDETELVVGRVDGSVSVVEYPSMSTSTEFKLPSRCVHLHILGSRFEALGKGVYAAEAKKHPSLYPDYADSPLCNGRGKHLCCVSECGHCVVVDCAKLSEPQKARAKGRVEVKLLHDADSAERRPPLSVPGMVAAYKFKGPVSAAAHSTVLPNRIVVGGADAPPCLVDLFTGTVLWRGKLPHQSLLGLQSHLDVRSLCFLEELGPDVVAVSTSDSFVYVYDMTCQRKPVYDMNVCDRRSRCLSARQLALHHVKEYNSDRRKELRMAVNEFYTADSRNIVKLATRPQRWHEEGRYERGETCDLFASDNVGSIYHLRLVTGDTLVRFLTDKLRKYQPAGAAEPTRDQVIDHLIQGRKRFGSASANDRPLHCAPQGCNQYICELRGCYTIHNGAVSDLACVGHYLISVGLDRFTNVYSVRSRKRLFRLYCNQKQTRVLALRSQFFQEFDASAFKALEPPAKPAGNGKRAREPDRISGMEVDHAGQGVTDDENSAGEDTGGEDSGEEDSGEDSTDEDSSTDEETDGDESYDDYDAESDDDDDDNSD